MRNIKANKLAVNSENLVYLNPYTDINCQTKHGNYSFVIHILFFLLFSWVALSLTEEAQAAVSQQAFSNFEAAHVHPLDQTPDGSRLLAVNTANGSLEIYFLDNNGEPVFEQSIKVGLDPVSVRARTNNEAWVVNHTSDSVSVVDIENGYVRHTISTGDEPADVIFAGSPAHAYISCSGSEEVLVINPEFPGTILRRITILGEQPRALAKSLNGKQVILGIFESGNGTTALTSKNNGVEVNVGNDPSGPYGGLIPFGNRDAGASFEPPLNPNNPPPSNLTSVIVKKMPDETWIDDNGIDWSRFVTQTSTPRGRVVGWDLIDRDIAIIDTETHMVSYNGGLLNIVMALAVHPQSGNVTVVGTDATNEIRFEPILNGRFLRVKSGSFPPIGEASSSDLNPHLTYDVPRVSQSERDKSVGDPRGIAWTVDGQKGFVTGLGSNNIVVIDKNGHRAGLNDSIEVGQGPTGIVLNEAWGNAYVLNHFDASISVINLDTELETTRVAFSLDPTPEEIRHGRPMLYDTHRFSGTGHISCASCHVDGKTDRLAWDLSNPAGEMVFTGGVEHHPMKGPMLTQTLVDMIQSAFLHWRGDRENLGHFADAFQNLQGDDQPATTQEIESMRTFLATLRTPPNPYRNLDNSYPTRLEMRGPGGNILRVGNAELGAQEFENGCRSCHDGHTGRGQRFVNGAFSGGQFLNPPRWQNFYKRDGLWFRDITASTSGFGFQQDGTFDSLHNQTRTDNMMAFMYAFNGSFPYTPPGLNEHSIAIDAHAAVGQQVTLTPGIDTARQKLNQLLVLAQSSDIGLIAQVCINDRKVLAAMTSRDLFETHFTSENYTLQELRNMASLGSPVTFTAVRNGTERAFALDANGNGLLDGDEFSSTQLVCNTPEPLLPVEGVELINNGVFASSSVSSGSWGRVNDVEGWTSSTGGIEVWHRLFGFSGPVGQATMIETDASPGGTRDEISQTITTVASSPVQVSFVYSARPGQSSSATRFEVLWNGQVIDTFIPDGSSLTSPSWNLALYRLNATGLDRLSFREAGNNGGLGSLVTAVSVIGLDSEPPLPPQCTSMSNIAADGTASQSSGFQGNRFPASNAIDGNSSNFTHTQTGQSGASWQLDFVSNVILNEIIVRNRTDCCGSRLRDITVSVTNSASETVFTSPLLNPENTLGAPAELAIDLVALSGGTVIGNTVIVTRTSDPDFSGGGGNADEADVLSLAEVEVLGCN